MIEFRSIKFITARERLGVIAARAALSSIAARGAVARPGIGGSLGKIRIIRRETPFTQSTTYTSQALLDTKSVVKSKTSEVGGKKRRTAGPELVIGGAILLWVCGKMSAKDMRLAQGDEC